MPLPLFAFLIAAQTGSQNASPPTLPPALRQRLLGRMPHGPMNETMSGQVLVKLRPSAATRLVEAQKAVDKAVGAALATDEKLVPGGRVLSQIGHSGWTLWRVPAGTDVPALVASLKAKPGILTAEPVNRIYPLLADPNDSDWNAYEDDENLIISFEGDIEPFRRLWSLIDSNAPAAWSIWPNRYYTAATKPADPPLIAVVDTGCDMNHRDFVNQGGTTTDVSGGGQLDKSLSAAFELGDIIPDGSPMDANGHGTHVTGIALAAGNNGGYAGAGDGATHGTLGTGYACKGMVLRVFDDQGIGSDADAAAAIYYAVDHGADVINLSLGTTNFSQLFQDAVTYAFQSGSLVVCAGNENGSGGGNLGPIYPAACSGALGVAANGPDGVPATDNYGGTGTYVDVAAPGGNVVLGGSGVFGGLSYKIQYVWSTASTDPNSALRVYTETNDINPRYNTDYAYLAGTSMASPAVAGAAGLYYGRFGLDQKTGWANLRTYRAIEKSASGLMGAPRGSWEPTQGYGALNMEDLLLDNNERGATVGAMEGIVYYNGTALANVTVRAQKPGSRVRYQTSTRPDGGYRFELLPPGVYTVTAIPFGAAKSKSSTVVVGSDQTGVDFWCGSYSGDETAPVVPRFDVNSYTSTGFSIRHWAYDPETGIDRMSFRIGTVPGAADVLADTEVLPESNVVTRTGLTIPTFNTLQARYTNGGNMTTTVTRAVIRDQEDAYVRDGGYANTNFGGDGLMQIKANGAGLNRKGYLKIDLSNIPGAITSAKLRFYGYKNPNVAPATRVEVLPTSSGWSQSTITWNNAPAATGGVLGSADLSLQAGAWYEIDVTGYVAAERAAGRSVASLLLRSPSVSDGGGLFTREAPGYEPQVIVTAQG